MSMSIAQAAFLLELEKIAAASPSGVIWSAVPSPGRSVWMGPPVPRAAPRRATGRAGAAQITKEMNDLAGQIAKAEPGSPAARRMMKQWKQMQGLRRNIRELEPKIGTGTMLGGGPPRRPPTVSQQRLGNFVSNSEHASLVGRRLAIPPVAPPAANVRYVPPTQTTLASVTAPAAAAAAPGAAEEVGQAAQRAGFMSGVMPWVKAHPKLVAGGGAAGLALAGGGYYLTQRNQQAQMQGY